MAKDIIVITSMYPNGGKAPGQDYCIASWEWWCKKNDVQLMIFDEPLTDINFMNPIWQKWWVMDILDNSGTEYNQIATIDVDTMVRWDCPNFFNMTHLQRKEVLQDFMFVECGYVWHFNGFDKHHREPLMKDTWDKIKKNYEK